jgi:hypothetical protein
MEIEVLSNLRIHELLNYRRERFPLGIFAPLAIFLFTASLSAGWYLTTLEAFCHLLLSLSFVFQFRLMDDLADVDRDQREHPERSLSRATALAPYVAMLVVLITLNCVSVVLLKSLPRLAAFLCLTLAMGGWYAVPGRRCCGGVPNYHVVLLKYPIFVYLLSPMVWDSGAVSLFCGMVAVYLCFCIYETLHDTTQPTSQVMVGLQLAALALIAGLMVWDLHKLSAPASVLQGLLTIAGTLVLLLLFHWQRLRRRPGKWCYAIFVVGFSWLFSYAFLSPAIVAIRPRSRLGSPRLCPKKGSGPLDIGVLNSRTTICKGPDPFFGQSGSPHVSAFMCCEFQQPSTRRSP